MNKNIKDLKTNKGISVVIPTKGRVTYLEKLLISLMKSRKATSINTEVIIIDDSSKKEQEAIKALCDKYECSYSYLEGSISKKRNLGIGQAKYPIVLFIDSDCEIATLNILGEHLKVYDKENVVGCLGVTEFKGRKTWLWNIIEKMSFVYPFQFAKTKENVSWGPCTNISYKKEILEKVGGFKSILPSKEAGEDVDLGYRVTEEGSKIVCNPNAVVFHNRETWSGLTEFIRRTYRWGQAEYYLLKMHPQKQYLDIPKVSLLFFFLLIVFAVKSFINHSYILVLFPFFWLLVNIFIQTILALKLKTMQGNWRSFIYVYLAIMNDVLFEIGTISECIRKLDIKKALYRFLYVDDQLFGRWRWGIIKMWGFILSTLILFLTWLILK